MSQFCPHLSTLKESKHVAAAAERSAALKSDPAGAAAGLKSSYSNGFWSVGPAHGFMPVAAPMERLPERYSALQTLIECMPVRRSNGEPGLLATPGLIHNFVDHQLPEMMSLIEAESKDDVFLFAALFRALTFVASAYLLEPAHQHQKQSSAGDYGQARTLLPRVVAVPLVFVANHLGVHPYLDYHYAYSLGNYRKLDPAGGYEYTNLGMSCAFSGMADESGFIMLHVDIVSHSPALLESIWSFVQTPSVEALRRNYETMIKINERRKLMWEASDWHNYNDFRVFIMGIQGNTKLFGDGVVYQDCFDNVPMQYRGQSGSQDDIIPCADIFSGLLSYYPENELTSYLMDMRAYRPPVVREFFKDLEACDHNLETFAALGVEGLVMLLAIVNEIYTFRNGHWMFVQKYILSTTAYPVATGGTPITSWLPNQIEAVLNYQRDILRRIDDLGGSLDPLLVQLAGSLPGKIFVLRKQQEELTKANYSPRAVHSLNPASTLEYRDRTAAAVCPFGHGGSAAPL